MFPLVVLLFGLTLETTCGFNTAAINQPIPMGRCESTEPVDMAFILDSSGSIQEPNFYAIKTFVRHVVSALRVSNQDSRVGLISYGNKAHLDLPLTGDLGLFNRTLEGLQWKDEFTNTSGALRILHNHFFDSGGRPDVARTAVIITDGMSNMDRHKTIHEARKARRKGIELYAIGVGGRVDNAELETISGSRRRRYLFSDFTALALVQVFCTREIKCRRPPDIVLLLDTSGSFGKDNFEAAKVVIQDLLYSIPIGSGASHVALVVFSDIAEVKFGLNEYDTLTKITRAIDSAEFSSGRKGPELGPALRQAMDLFKRSPRSNVNRVVVLFTQGGSSDLVDSLSASRALHLDGITILTVCFTKWQDPIELTQVTSEPTVGNLFLTQGAIDDLTLKDVAASLTNATCDEVNECDGNPCPFGQCSEGINYYHCACLPQLAGKHCEIPCSRPTDLIIAMDVRKGKHAFYKMQAFVRELAMTLNVNYQTHTNVSVISVDNRGRLQYHSQPYTSNLELAKAVGYMYQQQRSMMFSVLNLMEVKFAERRWPSRKVGLLLTDGGSTDRRRTFDMAIRLHNLGVELLAVGVGVSHKYDVLEMKGIASDPDETTLLTPPDYRTLMEETSKVVETICSEGDICSSSRPCGNAGAICKERLGTYECLCGDRNTGQSCERACSGIADVVFLLDTSGSIHRDRFEILKNLTVKIISKLEVRPMKTRIALVTFNDVAETRFYFNSYQRKEDVIQAVNRLEYEPGKTNIADAIEKGRKVIFSERSGARPGVDKFCILLSDGQPTVDEERVLPQAREARQAGIHFVVVAAEQNKNNMVLTGIASQPIEKNVFAVKSYKSILKMNLQDAVVAAICNDQNECNSLPCLNSGECVDGLNSFTCRCQDEYTGVRCERRCARRYDAALLLDAGGLSEDPLEIQMKLASQIIHGLNFNGQRTRVAVMTYHSKPMIQFWLDSFAEKKDVLNAMPFEHVEESFVDSEMSSKSLTMPKHKSELYRDKTNTASALLEAEREIFIAANGDRSSDFADDVVILMRHSRSTDVSEAVTQARELRYRTKARLMVIGVQPTSSMKAELDKLASQQKHSKNLFEITEITEVDRVATDILDQLCE